MSEQDNIRVAREYIEAANAHDYERMSSCQGQGFTSRMPGFAEPLGGADMRTYMEAIWTAFPDHSFKIDRVVAEGDCVVVNWTSSGTHDGPLAARPGQTIPPTGRKMILPGSATVEFKDGKLARDETYWDRMTLLDQLGVTPGA